MAVSEDLSPEECYLLSIITDPSGIDLAEWCWVDNEAKFGIWRAWPFQWKWYKDTSPLQIEQSARSLGKTISIKLRMFAFPFLHPGAEAVVTAPELVHLMPIIGLIENQFLSTRLGREMLPKGANHGTTHRPFEMDFLNGARIMGRIPQRDGRGIKGTHPLWLEMDEACFPGDIRVMTDSGHEAIRNIRAGDKVLTHTGNWQKVLRNIDHGHRETLILWTDDKEIRCTENHRFWAKKDIYESLTWIRARDMKDVYWTSPEVINSKSIYDPKSDLWLTKVNGVEPYSLERVFDLEVEDDHSFVAEGIIVHNSDYPEPGWTEIIETLKRGSEGAVWRAHGVTRGVHDSFYKMTQPKSGWKVHRYCAMWRPTWTAEERDEKIEMYGSRNAPDYRRNVLGLHGDATQPIFVLSRLMKCVEENQSDPYNTDVYQNLRITHEMIEDANAPITFFLDFPHSHKEYKTIWVGMDVGYTQHPSEILVFAEEHRKGKESVFRLLTRIHLERVSHQDQVAAILHVVNWYRVNAFSMDKTGLGLPLFQDIQQHDPKAAHLIKGYGFSEKIAVEIDETIELDEYKGDIQDALIKKNVLEASTDILRDLVDNRRVILPWDRDLIGEFQGQTFQVKRDNINMYGKRSFSTGSFHALDAARMAVLGWAQERMEAMIKPAAQQPVAPIFLTF